MSTVIKVLIHTICTLHIELLGHEWTPNQTRSQATFCEKEATSINNQQHITLLLFGTQHKNIQTEDTPKNSNMMDQYGSHYSCCSSITFEEATSAFVYNPVKSPSRLTLDYCNKYATTERSPLSKEVLLPTREYQKQTIEDFEWRPDNRFRSSPGRVHGELDVTSHHSTSGARNELDVTTHPRMPYFENELDIVNHQRRDVC